jgi:hypothetical protein
VRDGRDSKRCVWPAYHLDDLDERLLHSLIPMSGAGAPKATGVKDGDDDQASYLWRQEKEMLNSHGSRVHVHKNDSGGEEDSSLLDEGLDETFHGEAAVYKRFDAALNALFTVKKTCETKVHGHSPCVCETSCRSVARCAALCLVPLCMRACLECFFFRQGMNL